MAGHKTKVLANPNYRNAYSELREGGLWVIIDNFHSHKVIGQGNSSKAAWTNAWQRHLGRERIVAGTAGQAAT